MNNLIDFIDEIQNENVLTSKDINNLCSVMRGCDSGYIDDNNNFIINFDPGGPPVVSNFPNYKFRFYKLYNIFCAEYNNLIFINEKIQDLYWVIDRFLEVLISLSHNKNCIEREVDLIEEEY